MEMPRSLILRMMLKFSLTKSGDKPSEGSSISSSFGARIRPRPIETIACSPPDMVPASCIRRSARRGNKRKISAMRSWVTASEGSWYAPSRRFSSTVSLGNTLRPSGIQATPAAMTLCVGSAVMSWPSNAIRPARGGVSPRIERISVVLPVDGDLTVRAFRDFAAEIEYHATFGDALDHPHLMLDDNDGEISVEIADLQDIV